MNVRCRWRRWRGSPGAAHAPRSAIRPRGAPLAGRRGGSTSGRRRGRAAARAAPSAQSSTPASRKNVERALVDRNVELEAHLLPEGVPAVGAHLARDVEAAQQAERAPRRGGAAEVDVHVDLAPPAEVLAARAVEERRELRELVALALRRDLGELVAEILGERQVPTLPRSRILYHDVPRTRSRQRAESDIRPGNPRAGRPTRRAAGAPRQAHRHPRGHRRASASRRLTPSPWSSRTRMRTSSPAPQAVGPAEVERAIAAANAAHAEWSNASWQERAGVFLRAADLLARPVARAAQRRDDARPVEDRAPGGDRRGLRADRLLALQRRLRGAHLRRAAALAGRNAQRARLPPARGLRLRRHALQLHGHRRQPPDERRAHGEHGPLEARIDRGLLRALPDHGAPRGGGPPARRDQPRLRRRRHRRERRAREP